MTTSRRAAIMQQIQALQDQLAALTDLPDRDEYPDGTVIRVKIAFDLERPEQYRTYVLLKVSAPMTVTGVSYIGAGPPVESWWYFTGKLFKSEQYNNVRRTSWRHLMDRFTAFGQRVLSWQVMMPMDPPTPVTVVLDDDTPAGRYAPEGLNPPYRLFVEDGEFVVR